MVITKHLSTYTQKKKKKNNYPNYDNIINKVQ